MKRRELLMLATGLLMVGLTAGALVHLRANQRLGKPGIKAVPIAGTARMEIELPRAVPGYQVREQEVPRIVVDSLPADTSMAQMLYKDPDGLEMQVTVVMMGTDRTSIHQPQFCLTGAGWRIDDQRSERVRVRFIEPESVELPVMKLVASRTFEVEGKSVNWSGVYLYWFVADGAVTERHGERVWWMAKHLLRTGELQRWAYITYFAPCPPGLEDEAFLRLQKLMRQTVPRFQLAWPTGGD